MSDRFGKFFQSVMTVQSGSIGKIPKTCFYYTARFVILQAQPVAFSDFRFFSYPIFILGRALRNVNGFPPPAFIFATLPVFCQKNLSIITIYTPFFFEKKTWGVLNPFFSYFIINE
jgi:hypothetical protein